MKVCKVVFGLFMVLVLISGSAAFAQEADLEPDSVDEWTENFPPELEAQGLDHNQDEELDGLYLMIRDQDGNIEYIHQPTLTEHRTASPDAVPLVPEMLDPDIPIHREVREENGLDSNRGSRIVEPVSDSFPIANSYAMELNPSIAHGGNYFMVVYNKDSQIYASVYHNNGAYHDTFLIAGNWLGDWLDHPRVAYESESGLFLVAYHDFFVGDVWITAVSPVTGQVGFWIGYHGDDIMRYPNVICTQPSWCILVFDCNQTIRGRYVKLDPNGITNDLFPLEDFSNLPGERPFLAYSAGKMRAMLVYTWTDSSGYQKPVFTNVWATKTEMDPYIFNALLVRDFSSSYWLNRHAYATGVTVDPCTNQYLVLFDQEYSTNIVDVWGAAINIDGVPTNNWNGHFAYESARERSGGISFVTARTSGAACGVMNKLVVTYTNWDTKSIYALEIRGNNDPSNPDYERDHVLDHLLVAELPALPSDPPSIRPAISGGSRRGPMLIAYNVYESPPNYNVWGRLVTVWEGGDEIYLPLIVR